MTEDLAEMQKQAQHRLRRLIAEQGVKPLTAATLRAMGTVWPPDESVDQFLEFRELWRRAALERSSPD
jgi:hypothetical protein